MKKAMYRSKDQSKPLNISALLGCTGLMGIAGLGIFGALPALADTAAPAAQPAPLAVPAPVAMPAPVAQPAPVAVPAQALAVAQPATVMPIAQPAPFAPTQQVNAPYINAVTAQKWVRLYDAIHNDGLLLEGSYRGRGEKTGAEYRLHLLQYLDRSDTFIALLESKHLGTAVIGYLTHAENDNSYLWKEISVGEDSEQIEPRPTKTPMYRLRAVYDGKGRTVLIELAGTDPKCGAEVIHFGHARAALMQQRPLPGDYVHHSREEGSSWHISLIPSQSNNAIWTLDQLRNVPSGSSTEKDLARFELPGVMAVRETVDKGYETHPSSKVTWAMLTIDQVEPYALFWETHEPTLMLFSVTPSTDANAHENVLVSPPLGHRLHFVDPK